MNNIDIIQENRLKKAIATGAIALGTLSPALGTVGDDTPDLSQQDIIQLDKKGQTSADFHERLFKQLKHHEGMKRKMYKDSKGIPTIGIGFNLTDKSNIAFLKSIGLSPREIFNGKPLSDSQILKLYQHSVAQAQKDVQSVIPNFNRHPESVKLVLIDMMFNLGKPRFKGFKKMIKAVNNQDYKTASDEMVDSLWYTQVKTRGKNLVKQMRGAEK